MAKTRKIANTEADPTLATLELEIKGNKYTLCFDMGSLAEAEMHFRMAGEDVNLLTAFPAPGLSSVLILFPCAIHKFHPEIGYGEAQNIIKGSMKAIYAVRLGIWQAWREAMHEPDEGEKKNENPPQP